MVFSFSIIKFGVILFGGEPGVYASLSGQCKPAFKKQPTEKPKDKLTSCTDLCYAGDVPLP